MSTLFEDENDEFQGYPNVTNRMVQIAMNDAATLLDSTIQAARGSGIVVSHPANQDARIAHRQEVVRIMSIALGGQPNDWYSEGPSVPKEAMQKTLDLWKQAVGDLNADQNAVLDGLNNFKEKVAAGIDVLGWVPLLAGLAVLGVGGYFIYKAVK